MYLTIPDKVVLGAKSLNQINKLITKLDNNKAGCECVQKVLNLSWDKYNIIIF